MKIVRRTLSPLAFALLMLSICIPAIGQESVMPRPGPEFDVFKTDLGTWDVEIKMVNEKGQEVITKGTETNRMLGGFWMLTDFEGNMMGMDFVGHGTYSYDDEKEQYVGTWIDSLGPKKMEMTGVHDEDAGTMTYEGMAPGPDGNPAKHVMKTKYQDDGSRVMTMHIEIGGGMVKFFEMKYAKAKSEANAQ